MPSENEEIRSMPTSAAATSASNHTPLSPSRRKKTKKSLKKKSKKSSTSSRKSSQRDYAPDPTPTTSCFLAPAAHDQDEQVSELPPRRIQAMQMTGTMIDQPLQDEMNQKKESGDGRPPRDQLFLQSLPIAEAEPEISRRASVVAYTTEVERIAGPDRRTNEHEKNDPHISIDDADGQRAALISVRIFKASTEEKMGIGFVSSYGELTISAIDPNGLLANSPLRRGDCLISLDYNRNTAHWTAKQAADHIRNSTGFISFVVRTKRGDPNVAVAAVYKPAVDDKVGISFRNDGERLRIKNITKSGLLGEMCVLHAGDYVEMINSMNVSHVESALALQIIRGAQRMVAIRAKTTDATEVSIRDWAEYNDMSSRRFGSELFVADELDLVDLETGMLGTAGFELSGMNIQPAFVSAKVSKATKDVKLGISLINPAQNQLQISNILDSSLLAASPLQSGYVIQSLDNIRCKSWTKEQALEYMKETIGDVLIVAQNPNGDPAYVHAMADKPTTRAKLGLTFRSSGGALKVGKIRPESIFSNSVLNEDDLVVSINGIFCRNMSPGEAVEITQRNPQSVSIVAKPLRSTGIVLSHVSNITGEDEYTQAIHRAGTTHSQESRACKSWGTCACIIVGIVFIIITITAGDDCGEYGELCR